MAICGRAFSSVYKCRDITKMARMQESVVDINTQTTRRRNGKHYCAYCRLSFINCNMIKATIEYLPIMYQNSITNNLVYKVVLEEIV